MQLRLRGCFHSGCYGSIMSCTIIRTGPAVWPVKDQIRAFTGPAGLKDRLCNQTDKNLLNRKPMNRLVFMKPVNRPVPCEPDWFWLLPRLPLYRFRETSSTQGYRWKGSIFLALSSTGEFFLCAAFAAVAAAAHLLCKATATARRSAASSSPVHRTTGGGLPLGETATPLLVPRHWRGPQSLDPCLCPAALPELSCLHKRWRRTGGWQGTRCVLLSCSHWLRFSPPGAPQGSKRTTWPCQYLKFRTPINEHYLDYKINIIYFNFFLLTWFFPLT